MYPVTLKRCKLSAWNTESDVSRQGSVQFWVQWTKQNQKERQTNYILLKAQEIVTHTVVPHLTPPC